jgi:lysophospholipase L1-like esterase
MTNYGIQPKIIEEIVEVIKEVASEKEYELIDINKLTFDNHIWFIKDNVHPNNEGIKAIAKEIYEKINNKLYNIIDI